MAIAEVAARVGIFTRAAEAKTKPLVRETYKVDAITPFAPEQAAELAGRFLHTRWFLANRELADMAEGEARDFGRSEVQGTVLDMLGHGLLLTDRAPKLFVARKFNLEIYRVRDLTREDVVTLAKWYRRSRKEIIRGDFARRVWTNRIGKELKPQEARIQGNMFELVELLEQLGQRELVKAIDREVPDPNEVDFRGNRISTGGELQ